MEEARTRRPWWMWALLAAVALVVLLLALTQCGNSGNSATTDTGGPSAAPSAAAAPAPDSSGPASGAGPTDPSGPPPAGAGTGGEDVLTADGTALLPVASVAGADGALTSTVGKTATAQGALVQSVPADEGFWVGTSEADRIWVQLNGTDESGYIVKQGDRVDFTGTMTAQDAAFPASVGVDTAEGADQLSKQGVHIQVAKQDLTQTVN